MAQPFTQSAPRSSQKQAPLPSNPPTVQLSDEQTAIASQVLKGKGNIIVLARAGTGKTYLLRQCVPLMGGEIAVCAYNNKIAREIKEKLDSDGHLRSQNHRVRRQAGADVGTFHAFGWMMIRQILPGVRLEGYEDDQAGFIKFNVIADRLNIPQTLRSVVRKAMERAQERGFGIMIDMRDAKAWLDMADHYALEAELPEDGAVLAQMLGAPVGANWRFELLKATLQYARKAIIMSLDMVKETFERERTVGRGRNRRTVGSETFKGVISFTEMLYLPLVWNMHNHEKWATYNWVLVDEAQDSNPLRREMARRMLKAGGRMIWVGDNRQAIYGFSGADNDAMDQIKDQFNCRVFPMTVTFRCAKAIVRKVQTLVPDYKAANDNPEGEDLTINEDAFFKTEFVTQRENGTCDAIICRNTKPLVEIAYKLIGQGIPCHVEGKEIGRGLTALVERWPHIKNLPALIDKLDEYLEREKAALLAKKQEMLAEALADKVETVKAIITGMPKGSKVEDLLAKIKSMFQDMEGKPANTVTLLTAHRSKGLEFTRVFVWGENKYMPSPYAKKEWQIDQEINLIYVAWTRAIHTLVSVNVTESSSMKLAA